MYDCIIVGAGIIGTTLSRELSKYNLKVLTIEKEYDVATKATMANSAIVHSGHDPIPGTLKAKFNILGNRMYEKMSKELDIPYLKCGGLVVATTDEEEKILDELYDRALKNGLRQNEIGILDRNEIIKREPNISEHVRKALDLPTTAVTFPWEAAYANMENAMDNGVSLELGSEVITIQKNKYFTVKTTKDTYHTKTVINCTGVNSAYVNGLYTTPNHKITVRRGEYFVLDKNVYEINSVIYKTPSDKGKGVIITPQYHGNVLIGPTSEYVDETAMKITTSEGLSYVKEQAKASVKDIPYHKVIRTFAGGRASSNTKDFVINDCNESGFINVGGIESPGLTAAPAIAKYVTEEIIGKHIKLQKKHNYNPYRRKVIRLDELSNEEKNQMVRENELYGKMICRCEQITEGEIVDSIHRNCGARTIVGVKNRVRAGAGRCQGGFCQSEVLKILARELNIDEMDVLYNKENSQILMSKTKGE